MQYRTVALVSSVLLLSACGGGEAKTDQPAPAAPAPAPAATPAAGATAGAAMPITGKTIEVKMYGDEKGYRFEPASITAKVGDGIKFVTVNGGPHNVAFTAAAIPVDAKAQLDANFGADRMGELASGLKMQPGEFFLLSLGGLKTGKYEFTCTPHLAMNMKGTLTVEP
jgi:plastocyanin